MDIIVQKIIDHSQLLETPLFFKTLSNLKMIDRSNLAFEINDNINYLKVFTENLIEFLKNSDFHKMFLTVLEYAVNFIRLPFILYLRETNFCEIINYKLNGWGKEEKMIFKSILESILELFIDIENKQANINFAAKFSKIYENHYKQTSIQFFRNAMRNIHKIFHTQFEKKFNQTKLILTNYEQLLASYPLKEIKIKDLLHSLWEMKFNYQVCKNFSETQIFQCLEMEKENLCSFLKKCFFKVFKDNEDPKKYLLENKSKFYFFIKADIEKNNENEEVQIISKDFFIHDKDKKKQSIKNEKEFFSSSSSHEINKISKESNYFNLKHQANNSKEQEVNKDILLKNYMSFEFSSHLPFLENTEIEYKNFSFPFQHGHFKKIKKTVCAFLNTDGGRIYFGVRDEDQSVVGLKLSDQKKLIFYNSIKNVFDIIIPTPCLDDFSVNFFPIFSNSNGLKASLDDLYIVKVIIKRGKINDLYFTNDRLSYKRRNGKNLLLSPIELKSEILRRAQLNEDDCEKMNQEYNSTNFEDFDTFRFIFEADKINKLKRNYYETVTIS